ncbi:MAG: nucleotidyl transferase AbiEii/AbiGii toxin family protein [Cytophagales bacterium]|nr:nucleotidyl transferase AbiEii/AbiGii toxin family protein [Cytophagales bacterium]MDW8384025.1 nucleotidyl transferase AbiEii/AbiGii toxin family protein [Flammeovirgaceae bacterium]
MEYLNLFRSLFEAKVRYLICGGLAVNVYGIPRMTADIDLLLDFEEENIRRFEKVVADLAYKSLIPLTLQELLDESYRISVIKNRNLIAYSYYNTRSNYMNLDIMIDMPFSFEEMWKVREIRRTEKIEINIVSLEHLIEMKKYANRIQDQQDISLLSRLKNIS